MAITRQKAEFSPSSDIVRPNLLINGDFSVWQRGTRNTSGGFAADRFSFGSNGLTEIQRYKSASLGGLYARIEHLGASAEGFYWQRIEEDLSLQNETLTFSCLVENSQTVNNSFVRLVWREVGGPEASSRSEVVIPTVSTGVQSVEVSVTAPSITSWDSNKEYCLQFLHSYTGASGAPAIDGTYRITKAKLERGSFATDFVQDHPAINLTKCQRYYQFIDQANYSNASGTQNAFAAVFFTQPMRTIPSLTHKGLFSGTSIQQLSVSGFHYYRPSGSNSYAGSEGWTADAEL